MAPTSQRSRKRSGTARLSRKSTKRLRISIIGAGRLGTTLGRALRGAGHHVEVVVTAHLATARRAAKAIDSRSFGAVLAQLKDKNSEAYRRLAASDLIIIATPDAAIAQVANELAAVFKNQAGAATRKSRTALHTSGAISSQALNPLRPAGFAVGSSHPLVSVADANSDPEIFRDVHFCVEGNAQAVRIARILVTQLGGQSFTIKPESKPLYHAAAVMASGHVVALFDLALAMLRQCGLSAREAQRVLFPLLRSTMINLGEKNPALALTGPYARGDFETARQHLTALRASELKDANDVYKILARHSVALGKTLKRDGDVERLARLVNSRS
jgi:predicted short-subunit dehydrogenase-like oxidoreductase (DUF2520 family)